MRCVYLILSSIALLSACSTPAPKVSEHADHNAHVQRLLDDGRYQLALAEYQRLARLYPDKAVFYHLQAARTLISMQDRAQARALLAAIPAEDTDSVILKTLLQARLELQDNRPEQALTLLSDYMPDGGTDALQAQHQLLRARAHLQQAAYLAAARAYIRRAAYLPPEARSTNAAQIWGALNKVGQHELEQIGDVDAIASAGWLELALLSRAMLADLPGLQRALAAWQARYPDHSANQVIVAQLLDDARRYRLQPRQIALLLPLRGEYGGAAVRDGFMAAWYASAASRPPLMMYDASALDIRRVYRQAVAEGADFIVGPLEKEALRQLSDAPGLSVPTLALNRLEEAEQSPDYNSGRALPSLTQFGLAPEDEAVQVAERAFRDGHTNALIIMPANHWGQRLYATFRATWMSLGGLAPDKIEYPADGSDYALPVKRLLNIDGSEQRARSLRLKLDRPLEHRPRLRQDADMIFMVATPTAARQIVPQLRFHRAEHLPVYATSHIFSGNENRQADQDMNGVVFTDMPWILNADEDAATLQAMLDAGFQASESAYRRLYALGVDAYQLIPQLGRLAFEEDASYAGVTGRLSMSRDGRIYRKLDWGKIVNGRPAWTAGPAADKAR